MRAFAHSVANAIVSKIHWPPKEKCVANIVVLFKTVETCNNHNNKNNNMEAFQNCKLQ